jgi:CheY-like chemotaxis protein
MIDPQEMKVLIVDDMPSMTKFIHNMMRNIGYGRDFFFANSGREALDLMYNEDIDIVLLDYNMPEMSGSEVLSNIRDDRSLRDTPVVMVTAEAYSDFVAEIGESEIDAYIIKPITIKILEEKIARAIDKYNNPSPMIHHLKKAKIYGENGDYDSAIHEATLAMESNPNATKPIRELGYIYYKMDKLEEAKKWLQKAAELNDLDVLAFHYLGQIYLKEENIEKAAHYLDKAMRISPRHLERGIDFAKTLVKMGRLTKASQVFDKTIELSGNDSALREKIIDFCLEHDAKEYSIKLLESYVTEQPNRADLLYKLGQVLENKDEVSRAIHHLQRASKIDKKNVDIKIHLAKDYLTLNKPIMAEEPLKEVLSINPDNELAKELLKLCL